MISDRGDRRLPTSGFDRRALERLAVGAPAPPPLRVRRAVRARVGSLRPVGPGTARPPRARSRPLSETPAAPPLPTPEPGSPPPSARLTASLARPLAILIVDVRDGGAAGHLDRAIEAATSLGQRHSGAVLVDLDFGHQSLRQHLGAPSGEGIAEALAFGTSLRHLIRPLEGRSFSFIAAGAAPDPAALLTHDAWPRVLREASRRGLTLLCVVPEGAPGVDSLEPLASDVIRIVSPTSRPQLRGAGGEATSPAGATDQAAGKRSRWASLAAFFSGPPRQPRATKQPRPATTFEAPGAEPDAGHPAPLVDPVPEMPAPDAAAEAPPGAGATRETAGPSEPPVAAAPPLEAPQSPDVIGAGAEADVPGSARAAEAGAEHAVTEAAQLDAILLSEEWNEAEERRRAHEERRLDAERQEEEEEEERQIAEAREREASLRREAEEQETAERERRAAEEREVERARQLEAARVAQAAREAEERRLINEAREREEARRLEEERQIQEARVREEARRQEEERQIEEARAREEARQRAEEHRLAEARALEEARQRELEERRRERERQLEEERAAAATRERDTARLEEEARLLGGGVGAPTDEDTPPPIAPDDRPAAPTVLPVSGRTRSPAAPAKLSPAALTLAAWLRTEEERLADGSARREPDGEPVPRPDASDDVSAMMARMAAALAGAGVEDRVAVGGHADSPAGWEVGRFEEGQDGSTAVEEPYEEEEPDATFTPPVDQPRRAGPDPSKYIVPAVHATRETVVRTAALIILAYWSYYIVWRWSVTLNPDALWFSIPLALAETWGLLTAFFLVFTAWRLKERTPPPAPEGLAVDVFITTYDEPLEIIRRTAISARQIRYPHRTYVLDDGRRDEVRAMAEELGIGYLRRDDNEHAKAGNLNNALKHTSGDFILQLDADHAPLPQFLDRTLGFFEDPRLAFVQTPQDFYNTDSFTSDLSETGRRLWEEQKLFFAVIQPGKDSWNSAFFCGSCAVIRRAALAELGGFSTESITEDIETSLLLHSKGWNSAYYGESLAYGLAAGSADAFHTQHRRWARGAMQVLRKFNPIIYPGLTPAQRIGYFYSLTAYVIGLQKLVYYSAPVVYFLTGVLPIRAMDDEFLVRFIPYLVLSVALAEMLARGLGFTWLVERYQMAKFWTYTRSLATYFTSRRLRFRVTPKGPATVPLGTYMPQLVLMIVTVVAVNWATLAYTFGWVSYDVPGWRSLAFQANFLWAFLNFVLAAYVVRLSIRIQQQRQDHRFADRFPIQVRPRGPRGRLGERQIALTEDLNASGLRFRSVTRFEPGAKLKVMLPLSTGEVGVNGLVVHVRPDPASDVRIFVHGVEFLDVPLDVRDAIELHCAHHAVPIDQMRYQSSGSVLSRAHEWVRNARGEPRRRVRLPSWVQIDEGGGAEPREEVAFLEEVSNSGARLIMARPVAPGTPIVFEVPGTELRGEGRTVFSHALETPIGVRFAVGVRRQEGGTHDSRSDKRMRLPRLWRASGAATALLLGLASATSPAAGQIGTAIFGAGEVDTQDFSLVMLGVSAQPTRLGLVPVVTLLGYQLSIPRQGADNQSITAINPAAGLRYQTPVGAVQAQIGYLFLSSDEEDGPGFGVPGGGEEGIVGSAMADYWGTGVRTGQGIVSYNFSDQYLWSRARGAQQIMTVAGNPVRAGAEVVAQGADLFGLEEDDPLVGEPYRAFQAGGLLEYQLNPTFRLTGVVGAKTDNAADNPDLFPYFKLEFVLVP